MKIENKAPGRFLQFVFPELRLFQTEEDCTAAWELAWPSYRRYFWLVGIMMAVSVCGAQEIARLKALLRQWLPGLWTYTGGVADAVISVGSMLLPMLVGFLILVRIGSARIRKSLRGTLVASGVPVCLHCCYDVRGQVEPRCPECGREFDPKLHDLWEYLQARQTDSNPQPTTANQHLTTEQPTHLTATDRRR